jgi:two-component system, LytTR family, response regulator AlgR
VKVVIADDELPARTRLRRLLEELGGYQIVAEAANGAEALAACARELPELVLMDIRMPGIGGVEAARHLSALAQPPAVIFVTAYDEYAVDAFDAQAVGYLLKPVRKERLQSVLHHAARLTRAQLSAVAQADSKRERRHHIAARIADRLRLIPVENILYFQADQKYVCVRHLEGEVLIDEPLKDLEEEFAPDFLRIHRSALIAVKHLLAVEKLANGQYQARLRGSDQALAVSRRHATALRRMLRRSLSP